MHVAGRNLEEVADVRAYVGGLRAGASEVARGDGVLLIEGVIDLDDSVVAVVVVTSVGEVVVRRGRARAGRCRPDGQQVRGNRIHRDAILRQHALAGRDPRIRRNRIQQRVIGDGELRFAVDEIERLVLRDGPAHREAELVVANYLLRAGGGLERRARGQRLIAIEVVRTAMQCIRPGFDHHVDARPAIAPSLRAGVALHRELVDRFDGQKRACDARYAALIHRGGVLKRVVVVRAIDLVVVAAGAHAIDRRAGGRDAGSELDHLPEVAPVHRKVGDGLGVHYTDQGGRRGLQRGGAGRYFHHLLLLRNAQLKVQVRRLRNCDFHTLDFPAFKAGLRDRDGVLTHGQVWEKILALRTGDDGARESGGGTIQADRSSRNGCARTVCHYSGDVSAKRLRAERSGE